MTIDDQTAEKIIRMRLLIARAAQKDSLNWWEDDALTSAGDYLLQRLFLSHPDMAGRSLALEAAKVRYKNAFAELHNVIQLFNLDMDGEIELDLQKVDLSQVPLPASPIQTMDDLHQSLLEVIGTPKTYQVVAQRASNCLELIPDPNPKKAEPLFVAETLSWACLEGKSGKPIFPYIRLPYV